MSGEFHVVVSAIVQKEGKILLVQEGEEKKYGKWNLPGGTLNAFESLADGLKRELLEETGFDVKPGKLFQIVRHKSVTGKDVTLFIFHAEIVGGEGKVQDPEILCWEWKSPQEIKNSAALVYPHVKECVSRLSMKNPPLLLDLFEGERA
ncbi:NUDIX domain-containing protein [Candidatus Woesearchaeota archaeon]|nr:NUDIX domain-containing protein [Candidatus Woesearchaeota archaeon]